MANAGAPPPAARGRAPAISRGFAASMLALLVTASCASWMTLGPAMTSLALAEQPRPVGSAPGQSFFAKLAFLSSREERGVVKPVIRRWEGRGVAPDDGLARNVFHFVFFYKSRDIPSTNLCAVESLSQSLTAAKSTGVVWVWLDKSSALPQFLRDLPNVEVKYGDLGAMVAGTPLAALYDSDRDLGKYAEQNKANAIRLAAVFKHGGTYLDGDFVVVKDPSALWEGAAFEVRQTHRFNNAAFKFRRNSSHVLALMEEFVAGYDGNAWGHQGPHLLSRVFSSPYKRGRACGLNPHASRVSCEGIPYNLRVWNTDAVYPIAYRNTSLFFVPPEHARGVTNETVMVHCWHKVTKRREAHLCHNDQEALKATMIGALRSKHCPQSFAMILQDCAI